MKLTNEQFEHVKRLLFDLSVQLEKDLLEAKKSSQPVALDQQAFGRVSRIDAIQQQQMHMSSVRRLEQRIAMVRTAIERTNSDEFGLCTFCDELISFERLLVRPESPICIGCAKK